MITNFHPAAIAFRNAHFSEPSNNSNINKTFYNKDGKKGTFLVGVPAKSVRTSWSNWQVGKNIDVEPVVVSKVLQLREKINQVRESIDKQHRLHKLSLSKKDMYYKNNSDYNKLKKELNEEIKRIEDIANNQFPFMSLEEYNEINKVSFTEFREYYYRFGEGNAEYQTFEFKGEKI